jgi:hypothetical protein
MFDPVRSLSVSVLVLALAASGTVSARDDRTFDVTITNVTQNQTFTPILVATHSDEVSLFTAGDPAIEELEILAESGNPGPLATLLRSDDEVGDVTDSGALLGPGESVTISVATSGKFKYLSVAAMLVPTNDAFVAVNGVRGPKGKDALVIGALAYDAGTELNDELCASIPAGGGCTGEPVSIADGEGFVHVHPGIHGIGDLSEADYDWRNPVARVRIVRSN